MIRKRACRRQALADREARDSATERIKDRGVGKNIQRIDGLPGQGRKGALEVSSRLDRHPADREAECLAGGFNMPECVVIGWRPKDDREDSDARRNLFEKLDTLSAELRQQSDHPRYVPAG